MVVGCLKFNLENGSFMLIQHWLNIIVLLEKTSKWTREKCELCELKFPFSKAKIEARKVLKLEKVNHMCFLNRQNKIPFYEIVNTFLRKCFSNCLCQHQTLTSMKCSCALKGYILKAKKGAQSKKCSVRGNKNRGKGAVKAVVSR